MGRFNESHNTPVITTRFVIEENSSIVLVVHFPDGCWEFSGSEKNLTIDDYRIVSLGEIIEMDSSLTELGDMPLGSEAMRIDPQSPWRRNISN